METEIGVQLIITVTIKLNLNSMDTNYKKEWEKLRMNNFPNSTTYELIKLRQAFDAGISAFEKHGNKLFKFPKAKTKPNV